MLIDGQESERSLSCLNRFGVFLSLYSWLLIKVSVFKNVYSMVGRIEALLELFPD